MYLFIDSSLREKTYIGFIKERKIFSRFFSFSDRTKQTDILFRIDQLLKKVDCAPNDLYGILVVAGPGQFSSLRTGITIANTFAFVLNIPVVGLKRKDGDDVLSLMLRGARIIKRKKGFLPVIPFYGKEPNITVSKNKI